MFFNGKFVTVTPRIPTFHQPGESRQEHQAAVNCFCVCCYTLLLQTAKTCRKTELFLEPDPPTSHLKASYLNFAGKMLVYQELRGGIFPSICFSAGLGEAKKPPWLFSLAAPTLGWDG